MKTIYEKLNEDFPGAKAYVVGCATCQPKIVFAKDKYTAISEYKNAFHIDAVTVCSVFTLVRAS